MEIEVRPLTKTDDRKAFDCGNEELNLFFRRYAGQNQFRHYTGVTWVAVDGVSILGFATVSVGEIEADSLPKKARKKLPRYPLPILRLARLGVDGQAHGKGVGARLLRHVFSMALELKGKVGCVAVVVDAKPEAIGFYERYGFAPLEGIVEGQTRQVPVPSVMWLPIREIEAALG